MILKQVKDYIEKGQLFTLEDKLLVALSGGADSVALLSVLISLGYQCEAAHCNFRLRGEESDSDERFVRDLCTQWNIPLHVTQFDTFGYASRKKISIEMAARDLRYVFFRELKEEQKYTHIAVAHHRGDSVETILINLIRGTGIKGLTGIKAVNGDIVRPLLCLSREEIINYLVSCNQSFVTDNSNLENTYVRNKVRLDILPLMKEINPSVEESISGTARNLSDVAAIYCDSIEKGKTRVLENGNIRINRLLEEPAPRSLLFEILSPLGFNPVQVEDIRMSFHGESGKRFFSKEWVVVKDRDFLLVERRAIDNRKMEMDDLEMQTCAIEDFRLIPDKAIAYFDADKLKEPLHIRKWQQGDWFIPFGMKGKKRLSDYMTDRKYSLLDKEKQYVLLSGEEIIWVVGERTDDRFKVTSATRRVMIVRIKPENRDEKVKNSSIF